MVRHGKRHSPWSRHAYAWALAGGSVKAGREAACAAGRLEGSARLSAMIGGSVGVWARWGEREDDMRPFRCAVSRSRCRAARVGAAFLPLHVSA